MCFTCRCSFAKKVGEGSYGEVFEKVIKNGQSLAVKVNHSCFSFFNGEKQTLWVAVSYNSGSNYFTFTETAAFYKEFYFVEFDV